MFVEIGKTTIGRIEDWGKRIFGETEEKNNPYAFSNAKLWEKAIDYLEVYIEDEVNTMLQQEKVLVYTNNEKLPFKRMTYQQECSLQTLYETLEKDLGEHLTAKDEAYIACKFYNDIEQEIVEKVLLKIAGKNDKIMSLSYKLFILKMKHILKEGQEVSLEYLKELYHTYTGTILWKYHYEV